MTRGRRPGSGSSIVLRSALRPIHALGAAVLMLAAGSARANAGTDPWASLSSSLFSHIGPGEGLPYSVGSALAQDGEGYVWIGTPGGLARWDGYRMRVYRHRTEDPESLPENIVTNLFTDAQGRLWLGTASGLVARYDARQDRFVTFRDQGSGLGRLSGLADDGAEGAWAVGNSGLAHLDGRSGQWRRDKPGDVGLPPGEIRSVLRDRSGTLWLGTAVGLRRRAAGESHFRAVDGPAGSIVATALFEDSSGTIRFGTAAGRFGSIVGGEARLEDALAPSGQRVSAIVEPEPGTLWIAEFGGGIRELNVATGAVRSFRNDPASPTSIADDSILGLLVDRSGLVWASGLGGVDRHDPHDRGILTVLPGKPSGLPGKYVRSMTVRADGKVWLAFRDKGIALLDPPAGHIEQTIAPSEEPGNGLPGAMIQAIATPEDGPGGGEVWAGTTAGLYRVHAESGTASVFRPLGMANILSLMADGPTLWVGGSMGLARIDLNRGTVEVFKHRADRPDSVSDNSVQSLLRDGMGRLWVGTQRGLNLFDPARGTFRRFLHDQDDLTSLPNDIVHTMLEDGQGRLWVGTAGGIGILDPSEDSFDSGRARFRTLSAANGLPHDTVTVLQEGDDGQIWAAGGDRLATIDPQTLTIRNFGPMDGAGIRTHWVGSGARLPDGTLLFGGFGGMTVVKPGRRPQWEFQPPLVATDIRVGSRSVPPPSTQASLPLSPIVVTPEDRSIRVEFAALDFSAPERNRYAYRLKPYDDRWTETDAGNRTATYTNLSPGRYTLTVRGTNRDGVWSGHVLSIPFQVLPAWYQTMWFRTAAALAGLSVLAAALHGWTALLRRRQRELERQVAQRTAEVETERARALAGEAGARRAMEEAEAANRAKSRFLAVVSHEIRTPLNGVLGMLQLLDPKAMGGEQRRYLDIAKTSGNQLASLVESVLEYGRSEAEEDGVELGIVDPRHLVTSAADLFAVQAAANGVRVDLAIDARVPPAIRCDRVRLTRVLHNLLGNAVKFTPQGRITISLDFSPHLEGAHGDLRLSVADTGIGIAPDLREAIFQDFVQADDSITRRFGGTGLGLAVCRRIATTLGGNLTVESAVGVGSTFRLTIPVEAVPVEPVQAAKRTEGNEAPALDILLVDDDPVNRLVGQALIGKLGHRVTAVDGGAAAADAASATRFDVVLMDMHMPEMDGIEAIRHLRALRAGHPDGMRVVVMTADMTAETRERCRRAGVDRVVSKPLHLDAVRNALSLTAPAAANGAADGDADGAVETWLDLAFLRVQKANLGVPGLIRLGRLFARTSRRTLAALEAAAAAGDAEAVRDEAHRLRGAAGVLGLTQLAAAAAAIEARTDGSAALDMDRIASLRGLRAGSFKALFRAARMAPETPPEQPGPSPTGASPAR
ncbi:hybrid sensor histidine kinase/response regulator [Azospirillum canadense]|uniref:hybrid sensor histidine kinase/response regulator n=1 Tax=Azospirillum canadense TaxID=403962 RepID=UPI0022266C9C|nr:hybrid sensor histidine kinase/response regulator [Azospirillum canadense]MCW2238882.1 signal transduction histidine kinase/ligand-binding sensor domain-containing protein/DNA-binding response OmpR family regulator [Azospirillum canadense]